ncbi:hypothetical protein [Phaffia rhodozyma]|uniref:Uncharacterized protein n=1 Tax=Phaffia rhodozyma TaxID=264483 RepID=A0A0F7SI27_PHARH|nr:hypothetical protein [Phaffia rhodozyma]
MLWANNRYCRSVFVDSAGPIEMKQDFTHHVLPLPVGVRDDRARKGVERAARATRSCSLGTSDLIKGSGSDLVKIQPRYTEKRNIESDEEQRGVTLHHGNRLRERTWMHSSSSK